MCLSCTYDLNQYFLFPASHLGYSTWALQEFETRAWCILAEKQEQR